jgi:hypothetical protein
MVYLTKEGCDENQKFDKYILPNVGTSIALYVASVSEEAV